MILQTIMFCKGRGSYLATYQKFTQVQQAHLVKYATENGNQAAIHHYRPRSKELRMEIKEPFSSIPSTSYLKMLCKY